MMTKTTVKIITIVIDDDSDGKDEDDDNNYVVPFKKDRIVYVKLEKQRCNFILSLFLYNFNHLMNE